MAIHLYTKEEVENASDDNKSCLEQAVLMMEASKSSSMTQPDYSPTLERLFNMEGLLRDPEKGWRILYTDSEDDMMVVGNDPWHEFCNVLLKIHLYTKEEIENANGDSKSCLEQAALMMEASKSSSVSQPDSSPTFAIEMMMCMA
ncbi:hypothetical protein HID58_045829 [Brassica napus]|uniref:Auxin-responsive protein n=1 Tax=Brassica napus TaxID=3708 RepID=A0ABQ8AUP5_BRANA|nr:hypothetical protein HID58_045829 [Brassica napus]